MAIAVVVKLSLCTSRSPIGEWRYIASHS
jgi:hypothetical protein